MSKVIKKTIKRTHRVTKKITGKTLYLVTGATGNLGYEYCNYLFRKPNCDVIALYRSNSLKLPILSYQLNLLDIDSIEKVMSLIDFSSYNEVVLIHPVGAFKFEKNNVENDLDNDGINDKIFKSNVKTFENVFEIIEKRVSKETQINLVGFGSISDKFNVPFWSSYTYSKNILVSLSKNNSNIKSTFINVSTVDTGNENKLRPNPLEKENWLSVQDIVLATFDKINNSYEYLEFDVYRDSPNYNEDFFTCHSTILKRWLKQM